MVDDKFGVRVRASATGILTIVAFQFVASQNLPRIGYLTVMDKVMVISFLLLAITVLQSYVVSRYQGTHPARALQIDIASRWIFPLAYFGLLAGVLLAG
jgi:predicted ABC-type sugar transport system permease subunit